MVCPEVDLENSAVLQLGVCRCRSVTLHERTFKRLFRDGAHLISPGLPFAVASLRFRFGRAHAVVRIGSVQGV
jgi:hypothetical protein